MDFVKSIVITAIVFLVVGVIGGLIIVKLNSRQPEVKRKWTDPKFRDHLTKH